MAKGGTTTLWVASLALITYLVWPTGDAEEELEELRLSNPQKYEQVIAETNAAKKQKRLARIKKLESKVAKVPVENYEENIRLYKRLSALDPKKGRYAEKIAFYEEKLEAAEKAREQEKTQEVTQRTESLEYMLAVVDFGYVERNDIRIARFRSLLLQLSATFVESSEDIAGMTTKTKQMLEEKGISEKMLNIMEGMNRLFSEPFPNQRYSEYMGMYVVLRDGGQTHEEAIRGLDGILEAMGIY